MGLIVKTTLVIWIRKKRNKDEKLIMSHHNRLSKKEVIMYLYIMFIFLLMRSAMWVSGNIDWSFFKLNFFSRRILNINSLFENNFIDPKVLFATKFRALANISLIKNIDTSKAYALIMENFRNEVMAVYQFNTFDYNENKTAFNLTIFVLKNKRIVELGYDYAEIFYTGN